MHNRDVPGEAPALLLARIGLAAIFLYSGYDKLTGSPASRPIWSTTAFPRASPTPLALLAGLTEFLGGLAILLGFQTRAAALVLALLVLVAALIGHRFWEAEAAQRTNQLIHFFKNIAI
jgi:putative oxidoreductase